MKTDVREASSRYCHTPVFRPPEDLEAEMPKPRPSKLSMRFIDRSRPFTLKLEVGLFPLLDCIACAEDMPLSSLVIKIKRQRNPALSLPEAASNFIGNYYYLKAHAPMRDAMPLAFGPPPLRLTRRKYRLSRSLFYAWKVRTGLLSLDLQWELGVD